MDKVVVTITITKRGVKAAKEMKENGEEQRKETGDNCNVRKI